MMDENEDAQGRGHSESAAAGARLIALHGPARDVLLPPGVTSFGRRSGNDVVLMDDEYASGSHAAIVSDAQGHTLTDLGSTNGTLLNGERLPPDEPHPLSPDDVVMIGSGVYRFEADGAEADADEDEIDEDEDEPD